MFTRRLLLPAFVLLMSSAVLAAPAPSEDGPLAHMVFFKLSEPNNANRAALASACQKYLGDFDGVLYFSVGIRAKSPESETNATPFDVALHMVFKNQAALETYLTHPQHLAFIEEAKSLWSDVDVFDSKLLKTKSSSEATPAEK